MTTDTYIQKAANALAHSDRDLAAMTAQQIMSERGVSKAQAYKLLRLARGEHMTEDPVPTNQRERVLAVLYRAKGSIRNTQELTEALQASGYEANGHDAVKVMWSLQKTGHVHFRERQSPRMLYAIELKPLGKAEGRRLTTPPEQPLTPTPEEVEAVLDQGVAEGSITPEARASITVGAVIDDAIPEFVAERVHESLSEAVTGATMAEDNIRRPWIKGNLGGWPSLRDIRDRALKSKKLVAAAKLLEEAGEDDMALTLMGKTEFSPLEEEIISLLTLWEEI